MKKIVILENNGGSRLANQLWLFANVYAYCLEKGYGCENPSFFRYVHYFDLPKIASISGVLSYFLERKLLNIKFAKLIYLAYSKSIKFFNKRAVLEDNGVNFTLPPDMSEDERQRSILNTLERSSNDTLYFCGWLFRTSVGIEKFRKEIKKYLEPKPEYLNVVVSLIKNLRATKSRLIGVHVRHGDYATWNDGKFYYTFAEVGDILREFWRKQADKDDIMFVICSDEAIDEGAFAGLPIAKGPGTEIGDLYTLAYTDMIFGSNSSYGAWAAYYGNIPFEIFPEK